MTPKLEPCPFCASTNIEVNSLQNFIFVECGNCQAMGPTGDFGQQAVKAWNMRPKPAHKQVTNLRPIR